MRSRISIIIVVLLCASVYAGAQPARAVYTEATDLTITGRLFNDLPNPYHRADTAVYNDFTKAEKRLLLSSAGIAVAFRTNSHYLGVRVKYGYRNYGVNTMGMALRGFDLYIKREGKWEFAASKCQQPEKEGGFIELISNMDKNSKDCLLYLPMYSEILSLEIVTVAGTSIQPINDVFRHRVALWGSSFSQGIGSSRSGMGYAMQLARNTGLQILCFGTNGSCKFQENFTRILLDAKMDALIMDSFSNPSPEEIQSRLFPFIEAMQKAHPGMPIIFQQTIYRERRNFDNWHDSYESSKCLLVEKLMAEAMKKYKDVYFIKPCATDGVRSMSVDGAHPDDYGHSLWAESIEKPILKILKKYGIQ